MIELINVTRRYPNGRGIEDVSLHINRGEWVILTGPAGAGKSTILQLIYGEEVPDDGEIMVGDFRRSTMKSPHISKMRRLLGIVDQELALMPDRTVFRNVTIVGEILGWKQKRNKAATLNVLNQMGLYAHLKSYPEKLSFGERRKLAIARALVSDPFALIIDEPLAHLDPASAKEIVERLSRVHKQGTSILMASHRAELFNLYQPRFITIESGRRIEA